MSEDFVKSRYDEIVKSKKHFPFQMDYLTDFMVAKAAEELGETDEVKAKCISELRKMLEKEDKLVLPKDDNFLLQYLRPQKFNVKKAFQLMQKQFNLKKSYKDIYDTFDSDLFRRVLDGKIMFCLPYRDLEGCIIFVVQIWRWNPDALSLAECVAVTTKVFLRFIEDPATQVCGVRFIVDVKGATMKQVFNVTPRMVILLIKAMQNSFPCRFNSIHVYNENDVSRYGWSLFKVFLSEKITSRVHFHGHNEKDLHNYFPKIILPAQYGGEYPLDVHDWFNAEMEKNFEKIAKYSTYGYRE